MNPPNGTHRFRLGKFEYVFRGESVTLSLQANEVAWVRGKGFSEIRVHFNKEGDKWVYQNAPYLIKRKELMHETTPAQSAEIYATLETDWNKFWQDQELIRIQFKKYRRASEIGALIDERKALQAQEIEICRKLASVNEKLDTYLV